MNKLTIEPTKSTPWVYFDPDTGLIEMKGVSSPENSLGFYQKILHGLDDFVLKEDKGLVANLAFLYFNTSSSKCLFEVMKRFNRIKESGREITVNWYYETDDDDIREVGEDFSDILQLRFNFIQI